MLKTKTIPVILIICLVGAIFCAGCFTNNVESRVSTPTYVPRDSRGDVYYFNCFPCSESVTCECDELILLHSLSVFESEHPELEPICMAPKVLGYGHTAGYFVVFHKKT